MFYNKVSDLRKMGLIPIAPTSLKIIAGIEAKKSSGHNVRSEAGHKAAATRAENKQNNLASQYRSIFFPGGFTIQVEKESLNRIVLHKDGSVTVVQD